MIEYLRSTAGACNIAWPSEQTVNKACTKTDGVVALSPQDRAKVDNAYDRVALSIAAFGGYRESNAFTAKIDAHRAGLYEFTAQEQLGQELFRGKGKCSQCHVGTPGPGAAPPLFTDFTFDNLGVPKNPENPFLVTNPDWRDPGLAGLLETVPALSQHAAVNLGKQKVPTLRNVALGSCEAAAADAATPSSAGKGKPEGTQKCITKAYTHNAYFKSLKQVGHFYNTRDVKPVCPGDFTVEEALAFNNGEGCWPAPEVAESVNTTELGNLGLTDAEEDALVAFMQAMSDGFLVSDDRPLGVPLLRLHGVIQHPA